MNAADFKQEIKKFSFWGDILAFWITLALASFVLPHPWGILLMGTCGAIVSTVKQAVNDRERTIPVIEHSLKTRFILGALAVAGLILVFWLTLRGYEQDRFLGFLLVYSTGSIFASFLNFLRNCMVQPLPTTEVQPKSKPAPMIPPTPTLDRSGTLTFPRDA